MSGHTELPSSTYRLQIRAGFTLQDAVGILDYLKALGVDWVYLSPLLRAEPGSDHGYDVIDHSMIDPDRGGSAGFDQLARAAHERGMGILVDIVPNHMGIATPRLNQWWWDVLANGRDSVFARAFDVDWAAGGGRIRVPVLGDAEGELERLEIDGDELAYAEHRFPIAPGTAGAGDTARQVHDRQHYELVSWRRADYDLNYRRFFGVSTLAGLRVDDAWVFEQSHAEIARWFRAGSADGLRVDHPDGLADPGGYLDDLAGIVDGAPVWVEKILEGPETLPATWRTVGTTGYDALGDVDRVLVDPRAESVVSEIDSMLSAPGEVVDHDWANLIHATKRAVADGILRSEVNRLARLVPGIAAADDAIAELLASFPVYRSYLPLGADQLELACTTALARRPDLAAAIEAVVSELAVAASELSVRFQQTSGAVMAKGVEDGAFYRFGLLTSLNEVGGDPSEFAITVDEFHRRQLGRQATLPDSLTTLSTHDTKRGEDVRARIDALSEHAVEWSATLERLHARVGIGDGPVEHLLWEAVVGCWPASRDRLHAYAEKAAREAGTSTNWWDPNADFERRVHRAIDAAFDDPEVAALIDAAVGSVAAAGWSNGLSAKLVQLTAPGVPDVYQGSELWETSLVDPDNRRPVDFGERRELLAAIDSGWLPPVDQSGAAKLLVTARGLRLRRAHPERFRLYRPLPIYGAAAAHAIAFDRGAAITIATRLPARLARGGGWGDTVIELARRELIDVVTGRVLNGGEVRLAELLDTYPVALLTPTEGLHG